MDVVDTGSSVFGLMFSWVLAGLILLIIGICVYERLKKEKDIDGKHVVITGGSSGIGKSVAVEAAKRGAHVTIIARDYKRLEAASSEIIRACRNASQRVRCLSLDVTKDYGAVEKALLSLEEEAGPVYMLVNCAGAAVCGKLEDTSVSDIQQQISLNLLGTIYPTRALVASMKSQGEGIVVITGSQASLLGIYGYTIYSSTKFALRGFAEALHMEVTPYGVSLTLALPPDTDTPGFANEEKTKPLETRLISESAGLMQPDVVGQQMIKDALLGNFFSYVGFESGILCTLCTGMSPVTSIRSLLREVFTLGLVRAVSAGYLIHFSSIIRKCMRDRNSNKKLE